MNPFPTMATPGTRFPFILGPSFAPSTGGLTIRARECPLLAIVPTSEDSMHRDPIHLKPGQSFRFSMDLLELGIPVDSPDPSMVLTLTLQPPKLSGQPAIVDSGPVSDGDGAFHSDQVIPFTAAPGAWVRRWRATGPATADNALDEIIFYVDALDF